MPVDQRWCDSARLLPWNVQLSSTIGPALPAPVAANQTLSAVTVQRSSRTWLPLGANSAGLDEPSCRALRLTATRWSVIRRPPTPTLFIVSSMTTSRTQQSSPLMRSAVKWGCGVADRLRRRLDVQVLDADLRDPRRRANLDDRGARRVEVLGVERIGQRHVERELVAVDGGDAALGRRVATGRSHVCGRPLRTRSSICMNSTHASRDRPRMAIVSPTAKPVASATVNAVAPDGTYSSAIVVEFRRRIRLWQSAARPAYRRDHFGRTFATRPRRSPPGERTRCAVRPAGQLDRGSRFALGAAAAQHDAARGNADRACARINVRAPAARLRGSRFPAAAPPPRRWRPGSGRCRRRRRTARRFA